MAIFTPIKTLSPFDGIQQIYRFENGLGASVVSHKHSYGGRNGLWEIAVITFDNEGEWYITYKTPICGDVLGFLTSDDVHKTLNEINDLVLSEDLHDEIMSDMEQSRKEILASKTLKR